MTSQQPLMSSQPKISGLPKLIMGEIVTFDENGEEGIPLDEAVIHLEGDEDSEIELHCPSAYNLALLIVDLVNGDSHASLKARIQELESFARYVLEMDPDNKAPLFAKARAALEAKPAGETGNE